MIRTGNLLSSIPVSETANEEPKPETRMLKVHYLEEDFLICILRTISYCSSLCVVWRASSWTDFRKSIHWGCYCLCFWVIASVRGASSFPFIIWNKVYDLHLYVLNPIYRIISWQLSQGVQSTPESSLQYTNDNALLLAKVCLKSMLFCFIFVYYH